MNVNTIVISKEEAQRKLEQYKSVLARKRVVEDDKLQSLYASVVKGARVLNLGEAFKQTGVNERQEPKLAIARADWKKVYCFRDPYLRGGSAKNTVGFGATERWNYKASTANIALPNDTFTWRTKWDERNKWNRIDVPWSQLRSDVPHIPPDVRPKFGLHNYHILFEVKQWQSYPVDPFLMRRIVGECCSSWKRNGS